MDKKPAKKYSASILVVTMVILGLILLSAFSMILVSLRERRAAMSDVRSQQAFQNAQTGVELVMDAIIQKRTTNPNEVVDNIGFDQCNDTSQNAVLSDSGDNTYAVELKKFGYVVSTPSTYTRCSSTKVSEVVSIKSVGTGSSQQRAIEAAVPMP
jgi:Tfp pilus assembly protein PilV